MTLARCQSVHPTTFDPLRLFRVDCFLAVSARRGRRYPAGAHAGAVGGYADCAAVLGLRSRCRTRYVRFAQLRSNSGNESVYEARFACRPQSSAPRRPRNRPCRVPPAALSTFGVCDKEQEPARATQLCWLFHRTPPTFAQRCVWVGRSAPLRRRGAEGLRPRAQRAQALTRRRCLSAAERSERSEFGDGAARLSTAAQSAYPPTAEAKRSGLPARAFAAPTLARKALVQTRQRVRGQRPTTNAVPAPSNPTRLRTAFQRHRPADNPRHARSRSTQGWPNRLRS